jgi:hypothetical protein
MNTRETSGMRELTASELEEVTGAACAQGQHIKEASMSSATSRTPVAYFGGYPIF